MKYLMFIVFIGSLNFTIGQVNPYESLKKGPYNVGFKELQTTDYSRIYKNDFRKIQIALWYPINQSEGKRVKIEDYLNLLNSEDNSNDKVEIKEYWKNQFVRINKTTEADEILMQESFVQFSSLPGVSKYPLVLYAAGGQGESFENFLICEILASNGFILAAIPSIGTYIHPIEINKQGLMTQVQDLQAVLRFFNEKPYIDSKKIGAMGWSWGGLSTFYLQTLYPNIKAYVSLDGSIAGYQNIVKELPYYGIEKIKSPGLYFTTSEDTKFRTKKFVDEHIYSNNTFISLNSIEHSNFNSYSYLSHHFDNKNPNQNVLSFYPFLVNSVSDFFVHQFKEQDHETFKIRANLSTIDTVVYRNGLEPPLREDQLITLIKENGVTKGLREYRKMKELNPKYVPFEAFELTKVAFSLVRDSVRTNESVEVMNMVIEEYPTSASSYALRGRIFEIRGENEKALIDFKKAFSLKEGKVQPDETVFYEDIKWYKKKIEELENN